MDAQDTGEFTDEMLEILAVVFNTGVDCPRIAGDAARHYASERPALAEGMPPYAGDVDEPAAFDFAEPTNGPAGGTPWNPLEPTPFSAPVPVPDSATTMVLLGAGLAYVVRLQALNASKGK
jgi:hypothetical protein